MEHVGPPRRRTRILVRDGWRHDGHGGCQIGRWPRTDRRHDPPAVIRRSRRQKRRLVAGGTAVVALLAYVGIRAGPWRDDGWAYEGIDVHQVVAEGRFVCGEGLEERDPSSEAPLSSTRPSRMFCLDASTGEELFRDEFAGDRGDLSVVGETLLTNVNNQLRTYSVHGEPGWTALGDLLHDPVPVAAEVMVATSPRNDARLSALDLTTGEERWQLGDQVEDSVVGWSVASDGDRFYATLRTGDGADVLALAPESGEELWRSPGHIRDVGVDTAVPIDGGRTVALLVHRDDGLGRIVALDTGTGERRWEVRLPANAELVNVDGTLIVAYLREVRGFDHDGRELWRTEVANSPYSMPLPVRPPRLAVDRGALYVVGANQEGGNHVVQVDLSSGRRTDVADDVFGPMIAGGHLVVTDGDRLEGRPLDG
jgi:outer membrane protein assembly factor BamB